MVGGSSRNCLNCELVTGRNGSVQVSNSDNKSVLEANQAENEILMSRKRRSDSPTNDVLESAATKKGSKASTNGDAPPSRISSKTLQTTASNFFGTANGSVPTTEQADDTDGISRNQMLQLLDPLIAAFNAADFEAFAKALRKMCAKDVEVVCKLIPPMPTLESSPDPPIFQQQHCLQGVSALLLLWVLLHETHPDAVLQIIGKRICFRQVMENYELPIKILSESDADESLDPSSSNGSEKSKSGSSSLADLPSATNRDSRSSSYSAVPVSILESIWKFSGSCVTTQTMDVLFTRLSQDSGLLAISNTSTPTSASASAKPSAQPAQAGQAGQQPGPSGHVGSKLNPVALSEYINNFLTHERLRIPSAGNSRNRVPARKGTAAGDDAPAAPDAAQEQNRRYLIETRLVFNHQDRVQHWTFNLLAAESV